MVNVAIEYKRWFKRRVVRVNIPEGIAELTREQYLAYFRFLECEIHPHRFLQVMFDIPRNICRKIHPYGRYNLMMAVGEMMEKPTELVVLPSFKVGDVLFDAPLKGLTSMPFGNFVYFDSYYLAHKFALNEKKMKSAEEYLEKFIATFYTGVELIDEKQLNERYQAASKITPGVKRAIVTNYYMLRQQIQSQYTALFQKGDTEAKKNSKKKRAPQTWRPVFDALVGEDIVDTDRYASIATHAVLRRLDKQIKENRRKNVRH